MKAYEEIKRILVNELGLGDLDAYKKWIAEVRPTLTPTPERVAKLSPDAVDCRAFWKVCDELFGVDPVCNIAVPPAVGRLPHEVETRMYANRLYLQFARSMGLLAFLEENADDELKVLEIGPGYGGLKNYIEANTNHVYRGVDVVPRIPDVLETTPDGLIPRELIEAERGSFSYVVSSNVFQHLSGHSGALITPTPTRCSTTGDSSSSTSSSTRERCRLTSATARATRGPITTASTRCVRRAASFTKSCRAPSASSM